MFFNICHNPYSPPQASPNEMLPRIKAEANKAAPIGPVTKKAPAKVTAKEKAAQPHEPPPIFSIWFKSNILIKIFLSLGHLYNLLFSNYRSFSNVLS